MVYISQPCTYCTYTYNIYIYIDDVSMAGQFVPIACPERAKLRNTFLSFFQRKARDHRILRRDWFPLAGRAP